jgi:hypothetical protein
MYMNFVFQGFETKIILKQLLPSPLCFTFRTPDSVGLHTITVRAKDYCRLQCDAVS